MSRRRTPSSVKSYFKSAEKRRGSPKQKIAQTLEHIFEEYTGHPPPSSSTASLKKSDESKRRYVERDAELLDVSDIEKVWKSTRGKLRSRETEIRALKSKIAEMQRAFDDAESDLALLDRMKEQNRDLRTKSEYLENQLSEVKREGRKWMRKYETLESSMNELKDSFAEESSARIRNLEKAAALHEAAALRTKRANRELEIKYGRLKAKYSKLKSKEKAVERERNESVRAVRDVTEYDSQLRSEVAQLHIDNRRLVQILYTCKEYRTYRDSFETAPLSYLTGASFAGGESSPSKRGKKKASPSRRGSPSRNKTSQDESTAVSSPSKVGGPWVHFDALRKIYDDQDAASASVRSGIRRKSPKREMQSWVPRSVLHLVRDFHRRHLRHISPELVHEFLRQINLACRAREKQRADFVASKYKRKIASLRRQIQQRRPYKEVILEDRVEGLSSQLNQYMHDATLRANRHDADDVTFTGSRGGDAFSSSLALVENLSREVDFLKLDNERLKKRLAATPSRAKPGKKRGGAVANDHDYVEGAAWVARNAEYLTSEVVERVNELQARFLAQSESFSNEQLRSKQTEILERWAERSRTKLRTSPNGSSPDNVAPSLKRLHRLLLDRTSYELSSLQRRFRKICKAASAAWDDRSKRKIFFQSLPLEASSAPSGNGAGASPGNESDASASSGSSGSDDEDDASSTGASSSAGEVSDEGNESGEYEMPEL